ncbi:tRNA-uridine aminocarboxypropyltransferase 1 isoform X3 [Hypomesus transpacificus]|uniref:tRNA-uridine aminocarboxypropyltransferase 1 isoform X3 n=1 Tax=Hypomesus transpacificus TaxID=137520 RepID=UPI001F07CC9E|nr:tRNA-uridine aminocarboxypropyltransferase 1 isoform X3 [Hypomesus transpacificus]
MSGPGILTRTDLSEPPKQDTILDEAQSQGCSDNLKTVSSNPSVRHAHPDQPLDGLSLASHAVLERAQQRGRLPVKIDIIKHPSEVDGKSTAIHAKILAPDDVTIYTYPCIPEFEGERHKVVLVFPGPGSVSMEDMKQRLRHMADRRSADSPEEPHPKRLRCEKTPAEDPRLGAPHVAEGPGSGAGPLLRVVFIDSTWNQTNRIITDERLQGNCDKLLLHKECFSKGFQRCTVFNGNLPHTSVTSVIAVLCHLCGLYCCIKSLGGSPLCSPVTGRAQDQEDVFLAPSEGIT